MSGIMNMFVATKTTIATAVDAFFNSVSLLLNTSSTNGAQNNTFLDSSTNNFTITRNGNTTQGTFTPFSQTGWSNYFNGSSYLNVNTAAISSVAASDFSIECFVFATRQTNTTAQGLVSYGITSSTIGTAYLSLELNSTGYLNCYYAQASTATISDAALFPINQWVHVVVCRSGSTISLYVNGARKSTATTSATVGSTGNALIIGGQWYDASQSTRDLQGYVSNVRIVKGSSAYDATQSTITVPTSYLSSITNTSLLTCQSNRFIDNSSNNYSITVGSTPSVQAFSPFLPTAAYDTAVVGGSGYFDGTGDYLTTPSNAAFDFWAGSFTFEAWFYPTGNLSNSVLFSTGSSTTGVQLNFSSNTQVYTNQSGGSTLISGTVPTLNAWNHIVLTKSGSTFALFLNGTRLGTSTSTLYPTGNQSAFIGANSANNSQVIAGYVSNARLVKGTAVYDPTQTTLTIPTAPLTAITNTSLLLSATNAGIFDSAAKNVLETVGNAQVSTTQAKWGTTSMYFDGTGDYLTSRYSPNLEFGSGDFTVECWVYFSTLPSNAAATIVSYGDSDNTPRWLLYYDSRTSSANGLRFTVINGSATAIILVEGGGTSGWSANTWYHVAVTRSGSSWRLFRDGTQTGSTVTDTDAIPAASNNGLVVGAEPNGTVLLNGYIDDLRITTGYARYTATFTPPTAALPTQ